MPSAPETPGNLALSGDGVQLTGTGSVGNTVNVFGPQGNLLGTAIVGANGTFVITLNPAQTNGEVLSVVATDARRRGTRYRSKSPHSIRLRPTPWVA